MDKLPKKFPEYLIMYKTLTKKIEDLKNKTTKSKDSETIQNKIKEYELERTKIMSMFPEKFFDSYLSE
jgi:hypothetical protein